MSFRTLFKLLAALCVLAVMTLTGMLAYHIMVRPLGGIFARVIPNPAGIVGAPPDADLAKMLDAAELPDIDPGAKAFQKAHELLALGDITQAREKLSSLVVSYPSSSSAPVARRILGEMNLDDLLAVSRMEGKTAHVVKSGNSFFGIANQHHTTLDMIMFLNGMMELKNLHPGEEIIVMPLEFRLLIEPQRKAISLWDGGKFIREWPIVTIAVPSKLAPGKTKISSKSAQLDGRTVPPQSKAYRGAEKILQLASPSVQIRSVPESDEARGGILLQPQDMEEISLLTRNGNEVEIR